MIFEKPNEISDELIALHYWNQYTHEKYLKHITNFDWIVYNSHTLFTHANPKQFYVEPIVELIYKPNTWYIFNSQEKHSVINLDGKERVLFTLIMPKEVKYHDVVEWYKQYSKK